MKLISWISIAALVLPALVRANGESISPNMNLVVPAVGITTGPQWAADMDISLGLIDSHDHSPGHGVPVTPAGLNINSNLSCGGNAVTDASGIVFTPQSSVSSNGAIYESGVDLYFTDGNGNVVRLTQSGSIVGTSGSITGLTSPASASYNSGSQTFVWQSDVNTSANLDAGCLLQRNITASSNAITLCAPSALASNFSLTWPGALPAATTSALMVNPSGVMSVQTPDQLGQNMTSVGANAVANTRTRATGSTVGVGGVAVSASSGSFSTSSTSPVAVTNLSITITTSGRPVFILMIPDGSTYPNVSFVSSTTNPSIISFLRGATSVAQSQISAINGGFPPTSLSAIDIVSAGTYTYTVQVFNIGGGSAFVTKCEIMAYEL